MPSLGDSEFADFVQDHSDWKPDLAVVLGSGLGSLVDRFELLDEVGYHDVEGLHTSSVPGHSGRFALVRCGEQQLLIAQGRVHLYEGLSAYQATAIVRAISALSPKAVILTNAAGAINTSFQQPGWMGITDHINLTGTSPLIGHPSFVDLTEAYDRELLQATRRLADDHKIAYAEGVYAGVLGPQYETPAEIKMLRTLGADAVGMSTVLETIEARAQELRVLGLSCLTNWGAGIAAENLNHADVVQRGDTAVDDLETLVRGLAGEVL